ncbi:MAG TPA: hypothetical protein VG204_10225 [Terriglobia bacterium]|nr:hypothetical protein [Terriglobia bacterium]
MRCASALRHYRLAIWSVFSLAWIAACASGARAPNESPPLNWQSPARLHHGFKKIPGTLAVDKQGVRFTPTEEKAHAPTERWPFVEIQTFDLLTPRRLIVTGYENRGWRRHGDRRFRFDLATPVPPEVAATLAQHVAKPARNGDPLPNATAFATLPARHRARTGGSNGMLRFRANGIDYVTRTPGESRSWRWADVQTLANPDPYHLRVAGFRETFEFALKKPLSRQLFDRLWDYVYAHDLHVAPTSEATGGMQP